jgi:hypothetical protein
MYQVFVRNWWRIGLCGELLPDPSARWTTLCYVATEEQAQGKAQAYNVVHKPGRLSRKAEYTYIEPSRVKSISYK